jgi:3-hydroxyacyl-CoA dehydrogenase
MSARGIKGHRNARIPKTVGVVGLGLMGSSIAACFAHHGFRVIGHDTRREAVKRSVGSVREALWDLKRSESGALRVEKLLHQYSTATSISV